MCVCSIAIGAEIDVVWVVWVWWWWLDRDKVTMFTSGIRQCAEAELFPTDVQIAACLWDGLNYVQSNRPHIQCYLQNPSGTTFRNSYATPTSHQNTTLTRALILNRQIKYWLNVNELISIPPFYFDCSLQIKEKKLQGVLWASSPFLCN